jgi:ABC-type lipopolysaccharide export system ATPase subunit
MFGTTWCSANPTSVVRFHASVTPINSKGFKYVCDPSGGLNSNCSAVSAVGTLGTGTQADPKSFVIYGLLDGQFVVASWTKENVRFPFEPSRLSSYRLPQPGVAWKLGDKPITFIKSSPLGFLLASDGHRFLIVTKSKKEDFPVVFTGEWLDSAGSSDLVLSDIVFIVTKEDEVYFIYPIAVFKNAVGETVCRIFELVLGAEIDSPAIVRNRVWLHLGDRGASPVHAVFVLQPYGFDLSLTEPPRLNGTKPECTYTTYGRAQLRGLFMFYDSHSAWLIAAPSLPLPSDEGEVFLNVSKTQFFSSEDSIVTADLYPECFSVGTPASAMFGSFLTESTNGSSSIVIVRLDDLAMHSGRCGMSSSWPAVSNVVYRYDQTLGCQIVPLDACPLGYFLNGSMCEKRYQQSISLSFTPQSMTRRFITLPSGQLRASSMWRLELHFATFISTAQTLFLYDAFFLVDEASRQLHVVGVQQNLKQLDSKLLVSSELNTFDLPSDLSAWDVSFNGQHIFFGAQRQKWEIASQVRLVEICRLRANNDTEAMQLYSSLEGACKSSSNESVGYSDFVMAISMCQSSSYCPMFANELYTDVAPAGSYTLTPGILKKCENGFYCRQGSKLPCPRGFACPREGTFVPQTCWRLYDQPTTCYEEGLSRPKICPAGFICPTGDIPPIPAPPGFFTVAASNYGPGLACNSSGDFCSIGARGNSSCPAGFFCPSSEAILPGICETAYSQNGTRLNNMTTYCPEGSSSNSPCPAGFVCPVPWQLQRCLPGDYCPEGSQVVGKCPSGRFCPTPASSQICPAGFYCPERSWQPFRCSPLALCAESSTVQRGWLTITIELASLVILAIVFVVVRRVREKRRQSQALMSVARRGNNRFLTYEEALEDDIVDTDPLLPSSIQGSPGVVGLNLEFSNLELKVSGGKKSVLQDVSGSFKAGHLSAVMGPSGAGKSSLLSVLSGAVKLSGGFITVNEATFNFEKLKRLIGFVPQEDVMHRSLTVIEILRFNAKMRLPAGTSAEEQENIVQDLLEVLNLRKVQYSVIGDETTRGISGGERKRVNIGMELAANPRILFLDEPVRPLFPFCIRFYLNHRSFVRRLVWIPPLLFKCANA